MLACERLHHRPFTLLIARRRRILPVAVRTQRPTINPVCALPPAKAHNARLAFAFRRRVL